MTPWPYHSGTTYSAYYQGSIFNQPIVTNYSTGNYGQNYYPEIVIPSFVDRSTVRRKHFKTWRHGQLGIYAGTICYPLSILRHDPAKLPIPSPEPRIPTARRSGCRSRGRRPVRSLPGCRR